MSVASPVVRRVWRLASLTRLRLGAACALLGLASLASCSREEKKAGLIVAVQTDMSVPKDVDSMEIEVTAYGREMFKRRYDVGKDGVHIPATITVLPPK